LDLQPKPIIFEHFSESTMEVLLFEEIASTEATGKEMVLTLLLV